MLTSRLHTPLIVFVLLFAAPALLRAQEQAYVVRDAAAPYLNVRPSPVSNAVPMDCIAVGTQVVGIGTAPYWRQIRLSDGRTGWAAKKFLDLATAAAASRFPLRGGGRERF